VENMRKGKFFEHNYINKKLFIGPQTIKKGVKMS